MTAVSDNSWAALYDAQVARYQAAFDADHNLDAKGGVMLTAVFAFAIFVLNKQLFLVENKLIFALLILGCVLYLLVAILLMYALKPKDYLMPANTTKDHPEYLTKSSGELMYQLIVDTELAADGIVARLKAKAQLYTESTVLFVIGTIALLVVKLVAG